MSFLLGIIASYIAVGIFSALLVCIHDKKFGVPVGWEDTYILLAIVAIWPYLWHCLATDDA